MECNYKGTNCKSCTLECEEKAPEVLADNQGAEQNNQLHLTTDTNFLKELIAIREDFLKYYFVTGLISIEGNIGIHLNEDAFFSIFNTFETRTRDSKEFPEELSAEYNGVKFFCIK